MGGCDAQAPAQRSRAARLFGWMVLLFAGAKFVLQVVATVVSQRLGYGIFRDEMYYLVCGRKLAWGYVDQPPLVAAQARVTELLFGWEHMWRLRLLPALAGALTVALAGLLARTLGGGLGAAALAMLAVATVPVYLALDGFLSMNAWDPVFWMLVAWALTELARGARGRWRWWLLLGVSGGLGLENKWTLVFFLLSLLGGLALTPARKLLAEPGCWVAVALMVGLAAPNLYWEQLHGWPTLVWLHAVRLSDKDVKLPPGKFALAQWVMLGPLHVFAWVAGAVWLLRKPAWRWAGLAWVLFFTGMLLMRAKDYYLAPVYPLLFAAGAVAAGSWAQAGARARWRTRLVWGYAALLLVGLAMDLPYALPVLRPAAFVKLEHAVGFAPKDAELHDQTVLPQFFADRFGWDELVQKVAAVYWALPPAERARVAIYTRNYGEASAIAVLGARYGLPEAISGHQTYWLWGPRAADGSTVIAVVHESPAQLKAVYRACELKAERVAPLAMPYERGPIYLCHGMLRPFAQHWDEWREYR